jgi:hypothetical protein
MLFKVKIYGRRGTDGRDCVYRRQGLRNSQACLFQADQFGGGSIIMWAGGCIYVHKDSNHPYLRQS